MLINSLGSYNTMARINQGEFESERPSSHDPGQEAKSLEGMSAPILPIFPSIDPNILEKIKGKKSTEVVVTYPKVQYPGVVTGAPIFSDPVTTGLGAEVDALANKSPSLSYDLDRIDENGWHIVWGESGGGSTSNKESKIIVLDGNLRGNPSATIQVLAHEVGHARFNYKEDRSSKEAYVNARLADEGAAIIEVITVQREIIANGGPDIGIGGNPANHEAYNNIYDQYVKDRDHAKARAEIGAIMGEKETTSTTGQTYADYYGDDFPGVYVPPPPPPPPQLPPTTVPPDGPPGGLLVK